MSRILSKDFKYVPAAKTNIRNTFARIRRELKEKEEALKKETLNKVRKIK